MAQSGCDKFLAGLSRIKIKSLDLETYKKPAQMDRFFLGRGERIRTFDLTVPNGEKYMHNVC